MGAHRSPVRAHPLIFFFSTCVLPRVQGAHRVRKCARRRFKDLVEAKYFTNCKLYRVVPDFIIQWGIPSSPTEYVKWGDNKIKDDPVKVSNGVGTISFATSGPDARGSQIFVNVGNNAMLDEQGFSPIGTVKVGLETFAACHDCSTYVKLDQAQAKQQGNAYFEAQAPKLSYIAEAVLM